jgi:hypothetical protein
MEIGKRPLMDNRQQSPGRLPDKGHAETDSPALGDGFSQSSDALNSEPGIKALREILPESGGGSKRSGLEGGSLEAGLNMAQSLAPPCSFLSFLSFRSSGEESREIKAVLEKMLPESPGFMSGMTLMKAARKFGFTNLEKLQKGGVKFDLRPADPFAEVRRDLVAEYLPSKKVIHITPGRLNVSTTLHEMGHALDDIIEPDEKPGGPVLHSDRDAHLSELYESYKSHAEDLSWWQRLRGEGFWSDYATTNVHEYLADGIMFFTRSDHSRESLRNADPGLYRYIEDIMEQKEKP